MSHNYFTYITTNPQKTTLYVGVTNDLESRLMQHYNNKGNSSSFAGKYFCYKLVYFERFTHIDHAIEREKEIKKWRRAKKIALIESQNPNWRFLNEEIKG
jgi:putative endonuclease